jgi:PKD repeat protein
LLRRKNHFTIQHSLLFIPCSSTSPPEDIAEKKWLKSTFLLHHSLFIIPCSLFRFLKVSSLKNMKIAALISAILAFGFLSSCSSDNPATQSLPNAGFTYTSSRNFPVVVQFVNQSTSSGGGDIYFWDLGDGGFSTISNPIHSYATPGTFLVRMVQQDSNGIRDTVVMVISLPNAGPSGQSSKPSTAAFSYNISTPFTCIFTNTSTGATAYSWTFGDGTSSSSNNNIISKDLSAPGTYTVKLRASNNSGVDSATAIINFP